MYCVTGKTRNASIDRKSRDDNNPATGRRRNPVLSVKIIKAHLTLRWVDYIKDQIIYKIS